GQVQSRDRGPVEEHGGASHRSEAYNPRRGGTRPFGGARDRDLQLENQRPEAAGSYGQISRGVGEGRKRLEACRRHLERRQVACDLTGPPLVRPAILALPGVKDVRVKG